MTEAMYEAGFGSSSRAYEGASLGMTPARFAKGGKGERIGWCCARSGFWMDDCWRDRARPLLAGAGGLRRPRPRRRCGKSFPRRRCERDPSLARLVDAAIAACVRSDLTDRVQTPLDLRGTVFQLRVWQALRQIPRGETRTYSQLAREMGEPNATRAVARACALNRVSVLVPCHRVVGADGSLTGYRWGVERKRKLLEAERG